MPLELEKPGDCLHAIREHRVAFVDLRFSDLFGMWQHFSVPAGAVDEGCFGEGFGFDGSSIRGFQKIQESDMLLIPDPASGFLDAFAVAARRGMTATFMPKPRLGDNGSGMHVHQSLWKGGSNLFYAEQSHTGLSETARHYIGGLLRHAPALLALCAPTVNSYHRLVPGYEAPINLVYSQRNCSACCRIPIYSASPKAKRVEFRCLDPTANGYLAMLMVGFDGIRNRINPGEPIDRDLYDLEPHEAEKVRSTPGSLPEVLDALEADHAFLLEGDVFTQDLIDAWIAFKRENEVDPIRLRPHPYEFHLYYDA